MAISNLHPESVNATAREDAELAALEYAAGAVTAAMDALGALDMIDAAGILDQLIPNENMSWDKREAAHTLLRMTRRNLRGALDISKSGYERFQDMLAAHGLDLYAD